VGMELHVLDETEPLQVELWRTEELKAAGYGHHAAERLAARLTSICTWRSGCSSVAARRSSHSRSCSSPLTGSDPVKDHVADRWCFSGGGIGSLVFTGSDPVKTPAAPGTEGTAPKSAECRA
jgi:hypothetical protein